ncbi:DNA-directed RNA polymerase subunit beta' [bacterium]|nr:DNA-directed RNA polymerase subunit beta' [bacterium]
MDVNNFEAMQIGLASPEKIREWSFGEVKKPETINYRTLKPERDGLFCERIFGPQKDWECHCGKYKRVRHKGLICDKCGVEITRSKVRRERMGHINLASPVTHIWYFKGVPSRIGVLLEITPKNLEKVIYFNSYIVIDPGSDAEETGLEKNKLLSESEYRRLREEHPYSNFRVGMGAEAIQELLREIDLDKLYNKLRADIDEQSGQRRQKAIKRLEVVEAFRKSGNKPEWMVLTVIPVIPPDLRPMVQLDGARFATSDLNDLYRRVINRNNRLRRLQDLGAPDIIVKNEKRMLQEAVDALIDNGRRGRPVTGPNSRPLKSLSDMLKGKQGRFRQNLLGKRVDYSGRSVIVVGPKLKLHQCGLPKEMALELFKPFVMKSLVEHGKALNIKAAKRKVERVEPEVWDALEEVIVDHPVLLNRAPTLHRLGIQAFEPVLVEGKALQLHPLVCTPYNADFDGDQMAVHLPLSAGAQAEARILMLSAHNILMPAYGSPATVPTQDMVLGMYYLTIEKHDSKGEGKCFSSIDEALMAYDAGVIELQAPIFVEIFGERLSTTAGRLLMWRAVPDNIREDSIVPQDGRKLGKGRLCFKEFNKVFIKKDIANLVKRAHLAHGNTKTAVFLDNLKALGFKFATRSGTSISLYDIKIPAEKGRILAAADEKVEIANQFLALGFLTEYEHYLQLNKIWATATDEVGDVMMNHLDRLNPVFMMATSGARGNPSQVKQLAGMRGLMADPTGRIIPMPIRANLREGLTVLEYFIGTHGARKGLADTALRTADSGYLTRRLIDVSQDIIVRQEDCGTNQGLLVEALVEAKGASKNVRVSLVERLTGRYSAQDLDYKDRNGNDAHISSGELIEEEQATDIVRWLEAHTDSPSFRVRSVMTCHAEHGVCAKCYGLNLATGKTVEIGETVGIIAAQSIGEPGTQLTLRTFHTGGVAQEDIVSGLPRVEELFEARKPKNLGYLAEITGVVSLGEEKGQQKVTITRCKVLDTPVFMGNDENGKPMYKKYDLILLGTDKEGKPVYDAVDQLVPHAARLKVKEGDYVNAGDVLVDGSMDPHSILRIKGLEDVQRYIVDQVQNVYRDQGVNISDKHIEVIVRQMLRKVRIVDAGDTDMLPGSLQDVLKVEMENDKIRVANSDIIASMGAEEAENSGSLKKLAIHEPVLLGVTKASLATDSFLSAASFQETTKVLTEAAINGKIDHLRGLKENVIIGKLIPAGTGMDLYRQVKVGLRDGSSDTYKEKKPSNLIIGSELRSPEEDLAITLGGMSEDM